MQMDESKTNNYALNPPDKITYLMWKEFGIGQPKDYVNKLQSTLDALSKDDLSEFIKFEKFGNALLLWQAMNDQMKQECYEYAATRSESWQQAFLHLVTMNFPGLDMSKFILDQNTEHRTNDTGILQIFNPNSSSFHKMAKQNAWNQFESYKSVSNAYRGYFVRLMRFWPNEMFVHVKLKITNYENYQFEKIVSPVHVKKKLFGKKKDQLLVFVTVCAESNEIKEDWKQLKQIWPQFPTPEFPIGNAKSCSSHYIQIGKLT